MNKFAIIKFGPFQYTVEEGKEYSVPKFAAEVGKKITVSEVLAVGSDKDLQVGMPNLDKAKVEIEILEQGKGEKVVKQIHRAKVRYKRKIGHRKLVTRFKVIQIS